MTQFEIDFRKAFCDSVDPADSLCWKDHNNDADGIPCEMDVIAWVEEYFKVLNVADACADCRIKTINA